MKIPGKAVRIIAALLSAAVLTGAVVRGKTVEAKIQETQEHMAEEVLRFHVLANSDSKEDQKLKMKVKDEVVEYLQDAMGKTAKSLEETRRFVRKKIPQIQQEAEKTVRQEGYRYDVTVTMENTMFPEKTYGDIVFPAGEYEALRIEIGEAKGHNWWCVLYPSLCFIDTVHAVVPEKGKQQLKHVLTEEEYEMVTASSKFKIKWFFFGK